MVGCLHSPTTEEAAAGAEQTEDLKIQSFSGVKKSPSPKDHLDFPLPELEDFAASFSDSFLDFDSINCWFSESNIGLNCDKKMDELGENLVDIGFGKSENITAVESSQVGGDVICKKDVIKDELSGRVEYLEQEKGESGVVDVSVEMGSELANKEIIDAGILRREELSGKLVNFGCLIEEQMGKVSLDAVSNASILDKSLENGENMMNAEMDEASDNDANLGNGLNVGEAINSGIGAVMDGVESGMSGHEAPNDEDENDTESESESESEGEGESESESESTSSSSSSSSSDEEDEYESNDKKRVLHEGEVDVEEGEILPHVADETVAWSDDEDDDGGSGVAGPIASKNELKVLPPVHSVTVSLQPHHQTFPVGIISSIIGAQVIVEGIEKHNPLNEGSVLWITESRSPLGIVDEIFGPVKNPYYVVRYNLECEVPANIQPGTSISFVSEFANHVLNDKSLYQKGYDASGENDEELTNELEFSDDEKEAEHKRMLKTKRRGTNESTFGVKRKDKRQWKNQMGNQKCNQVPVAKTPSSSDNLLVTEGQYPVPPVESSLKKETNLCFSGIGLNFAGNETIAPPFPVRPPTPGFSAPNGIWPNGFLGQPALSAGFSSGLMANCVPWMQLNQPYQLHQMPFQTGVAFQQPNSIIPGWPFNLRPPDNQSNFGGAPAFAPWPGFLDQNLLHQSQIGMGSPAQDASLPPCVVEQVLQSDGSHISNNSLQPTPMNAGNRHAFNQDRGGGRRGHHRGGRRYGGGRGMSQSRQQS